MDTENQNQVSCLTLRIASKALSDKELELYIRFYHHLMKHSSVNGLVNEQIVQEMYDMLVENSRKYLDYPSTVDAKALQPKGKDRRKPQEQNTGKGSVDYACHYCGSVDHWIKDCPNKPAQMGQPTGNQQYGSQNQSSNPVNKGQPAKA